MNNTIIGYTLGLQRILLILCGLSFVSIVGVVVYLDPTQNSLYIWVLLSLVFVFLTSVLSLSTFLWFFTIKKVILTIREVNRMVYQSTVTSGLLILIHVLRQIHQLSIWTFLIVLLGYGCYQIWAYNE
jgi:hypothetical protein